jgi:hypothetical protein
MKIYEEIEKEGNNKEAILLDIKKSPKSGIFLNIFDKARFIELISDNLKKGEKIILKIDEDNDEYNLLKTSLPRFIIQNNIESDPIPLIDYLKKFEKSGFEISVKKEKNDYILKIKKIKDEKLDLRLKLDTDRTIDLKLLNSDRDKKDKVFFGVRSYYYVKKTENE